MQRLQVEAREHGLQVVGDLRMRVEHRLADDRRGRVDGLHVLVVVEHREPGGRDAAVGAVDHRGVHAVRLLRGGLDRRRGVAARQHEHLLRLQFEAVRLLERRQRGRAVDELGRRGELHLAAGGDPLAEIAERLQMPRLRDRVEHRDTPCVVRGRGREPDDPVCRVIELPRERVALRGVLPRGIVGLVEEERGVARVFRIDVDFACRQRPADDRRRAEPDLVDDGDSVGLEHLRDHVAEQVAFGIDLRRDDDRAGGARAGRGRAEGNGERGGGRAQGTAETGDFHRG
ncbi:ABC glycine betaine/choline transporter, periplasmic ligand binding domain protein [Burkholderia pseudomallei]|nr:ABC glycine betaine/choline transporter, periplasmic ligand binding domain protein [Burkholderia pseudomallei]